MPVNGSIQLGSKDQTWFDAHPTLVLLDGQVVFLKGTSTFKIGDGVKILETLNFSNVFTDIIMIDDESAVPHYWKIKIDSTGMPTFPGENLGPV